MAVLAMRPRRTMGNTSLALVTDEEMNLCRKLDPGFVLVTAVVSAGAFWSSSDSFVVLAGGSAGEGTAMPAHTASATAPTSLNKVADQPSSPTVMAALSNPAD